MMSRTFYGAFALVGLTTCLLLSCAAAADDADATAAAAAESTGQKSDNEEQLKIEVISKPDDCVRTTQDGNLLKVHYTGYLSNGKVFDSSHDRNQPFVFPLGHRRVIKGWDQGMRDMCVGEKRRLTIPPSYGYGKTGFGDVIGPDETLIFEVELIEIQEMAKTEDSYRFEDLDLDKDGRLSRDEVKDYLWKMSKRLEEIAMQMETRDGRMGLINKVMSIHDKNKDGYLDEEEFYTPTDAADHDEL